jgi:hypothetical protein
LCSKHPPRRRHRPAIQRRRPPVPEIITDLSRLPAVAARRRMLAAARSNELQQLAD